MKRTLPLALLMIFAFVSFIPFFTPDKGVEAVHDIFRNKVLKIVTTFALVLGLGSLMQYHWDRVRRRRPAWVHSTILIISMVVTAVIGLFGGFQEGQGVSWFPIRIPGTVPSESVAVSGVLPVKLAKRNVMIESVKIVDPATGNPYELKKDYSLLQIEGNTSIVRTLQSAIPPGSIQVSYTYEWFAWDLQTLYNNIIVACGASMFAILAFYMSSAAYRAFRARNLDATILLVSAFIVMLGQIPVGTYLLDFMHFDVMRQWILDVPNLASKRGIGFGIALGVIATCIKIILGIERSWLGGGGD